MDYVENKTQMNGMFEFEKYSLVSFIYADIIGSRAKNNKASLNMSSGELNYKGGLFFFHSGKDDIYLP